MFIARYNTECGLGAEVRPHHAQARRDQASCALLADQGAVGTHGDVDAEVSQVANIRLQALVQERLVIAMQGDDAHVEA